jgi:hypothetical protein
MNFRPNDLVPLEERITMKVFKEKIINQLESHRRWIQCHRSVKNGFTEGVSGRQAKGLRSRQMKLDEICHLIDSMKISLQKTRMDVKVPCVFLF